MTREIVITVTITRVIKDPKAGDYPGAKDIFEMAEIEKRYLEEEPSAVLDFIMNESSKVEVEATALVSKQE
jgi:hypothetical protein